MNSSFYVGVIDETYFNVWTDGFKKCQSVEEAKDKVKEFCGRACNIPMDEAYISEYRRQNGYQYSDFYVDYKQARNYNCLSTDEHKDFVLKLGGVEGKEGHKHFPSKKWREFEDGNLTVYYRNFWIRSELEECLIRYVEGLF